MDGPETAAVIELLSKPMTRLDRAADPILTAARLDTRLRDPLGECLTVDDGCESFTRSIRNIATSPCDQAGLESWAHSFHLDRYFSPSHAPGGPDWDVRRPGRTAGKLLDRTAALTRRRSTWTSAARR